MDALNGQVSREAPEYAGRGGQSGLSRELSVSRDGAVRRTCGSQGP